MRKENNFVFHVSRRLRIILAVVLLLVFFSPVPIKLADVIVHHHYTSHYTKQKEEGYNPYNSLCPIPGFNFHSFTFQPSVPKLDGTSFLHKIDVFRTLKPYLSRFVLSFSLRGPPLLDILS
ncbi:MAG: hypothetical protein JXR71_01770 [Bacteroidales bacterium]|nr:hypothetical protein [Bacteroidales bacterium]